MVTHSKLSEHREERSVSIRFLQVGVYAAGQGECTDELTGGFSLFHI